MTRSLRLRLGMLAFVLALMAVLIPASPLYLPRLVTARMAYGGRSVTDWIEALDSPDRALRRRAIFALGAIGPQAGEAVPALTSILQQDSDQEARSEAALALSKIKSPLAVPALAAALEDREPRVRIYAGLALFRLGREARPAVPALIRALDAPGNDSNADLFTFTIREIVTLALGRAGTSQAIVALRGALDTAGSEQARIATVRALGEVGPEARSARRRLEALLGDNSNEVRLAAREALRLITGRHLADALSAQMPPPGRLQLAEGERQYLWDVEHHGNVLVKYGFGPLAVALRAADRRGLSRLLADDFAGSDLHQPRRVMACTGGAELERLQDSGHSPKSLDRGAFVRWLLQLRRGLVGQPQVKLALMTLAPKRRGLLDGLWEATTQLRFHGEHAPGAPAEVVAVLRLQLRRPTEAALARPGWLRQAEVLQVHRARAPRYLFAEVGKKRGLDAARLHDNWKSARTETVPGGIYVCDFDGDGILDVLVTDVTGNTLYKGRPDGTFEDVTARLGLPRRPEGGLAAAWVDLDGDGWPDLILAGRVWRNDRGRRFADYSDRCNLRLPNRVSSIAVADYDRDGRLDLYVTRTGRPGEHSWLDGKSGESEGNHLYRNRGNWQFEDVTARTGTGAGYRSSFAAAWLDADNDGWPDLHVINEFGDGVLLVNNRNGTFSQRKLADRPADFGTMGLAVGDVDNDGNIDIYCANMYSKAGTRVLANLAPGAYSPAVREKMDRFVAGSQLHLNKGGLKFEQAGARMQVAAVGWAYGACLADLDNDGWLDLYATAGFVSRDRDEPDG